VLGSDRALLVAGAAGTLSSLVSVAAARLGLPALLVASGLLGGLYMAVGQMRWGAVYCREGARSAVVCVSGAFAFAVVLDAAPLLMVVWARQLAFALFPLASVLVLAGIDAPERSYAEPPAAATRTPGRTLRAWFTDYLGIPVTVVAGLMLVMFVFGYLQHLVSFSAVAAGGASHGVLIQTIRGACAIAMFVLVVLFGRASSVVWRAGLLAMVAGFMLMPFVFGAAHFWVAGAVAMAGYTAFDILSWTVSSQEAYAQSADPVRTIASFRFLTAVCYVLGALAGVLLVGFGDADMTFVSQETTVVGYLAVIAVVLLLSSDDIHVLFRGNPFDPAAEEPAEAGRAQEPAPAPDAAPLDALCTSIGLTARERDVAALLLQGRTQPWIARSLGISENTVGTHMRHIYQKAGVHDRQQFIDLAGRGGQAVTRIA
jgi:DNA-binding CsgD family transcriptional regulator